MLCVLYNPTLNKTMNHSIGSFYVTDHWWIQGPALAPQPEKSWIRHFLSLQLWFLSEASYWKIFKYFTFHAP